MGQLFQKIELVEDDGRIEFQFPTLQLYFELQQSTTRWNWKELSMIKSKYNDYVEVNRAKRFGDRNTKSISRYSRRI